MTQKHIFLIVLAGLWGFLNKARVSLQSDLSTWTIMLQREEYDTLRRGRFPPRRQLQMPPLCLSVSHVLRGWTDKSACTKDIKPTNTHLRPHTQKSNTLRHFYLFSLSPWTLSPSAFRTQWRRDGPRMLCQPFSFLDNLITSDRGDAARSLQVQGHSTPDPQLRTGPEQWAHGQQQLMRSDSRSTSPSNYTIIQL